MSYFRVGRVIAVVIVGTVEIVIVGQGSDTYWFWLEQMFLNFFNIEPGVMRLANLRSDSQSNQSIWSEPFLLIFKGTVDNISINACHKFLVSWLSFKELVVKAISDFFCPLAQTNRGSLVVNSIVRVISSCIEGFKGTKARVKKAYQLDRSACSWSWWHSFGCSVSWRAHFIHPSQTVVFVATNDKSSSSINFQVDVESFYCHIGVDFEAWVPLSERDSFSMGLKYVMNYFL